MNDSRIDLKPCPFCAGRAEVERIGSTRQSMIIQCTGCGCRMETGEVPGVCGWENITWNYRPTNTEQGEGND